MTTIAKALSLLNHLSEARPALGLSDFQRLSGRDKATVHRYLTALESLGFLEQNTRNKSYRLGHSIERLAAMRRRTVEEADTVSPFADVISETVGELVHINKLTGQHLHPLYQVDLAPHAVRVEIEPNVVLPLLTTSSGKAILAFKERADQETAIAHQKSEFSEGSLADANAIFSELTETTKRGYATSRDQIEIGVSSIAIPLFDANKSPVAACSIAYPTARHSAEHLSKCIKALCTHGAKMSERLGGEVPGAVKELWHAGLKAI